MSTEYVAVLPAEDASNAENYDGQKEQTDEVLLIAFHKRHGFITVADARVWMGRARTASTAYGSVWLRGAPGSKAEGRYFSGRGTAGGYGYCRASACLGEALHSAGIGGNVRQCGGAGMSSVKMALDACAKALGYGRGWSLYYARG